MYSWKKTWGHCLLPAVAGICSHYSGLHTRDHGARPLCAPADGECNIANVDTRSQIKVLSSSIYVSPSDTVVQPRVVQVTCHGIANRKTEMSCHADGTWQAASTCSTTFNTGSAVSTATTVTAVTTVTAHEKNVGALVRDNLLIVAVSVVIFIAILFVATVCMRMHSRFMSVSPKSRLRGPSTKSTPYQCGCGTGRDISYRYDKVEYFYSIREKVPTAVDS